MIECREKQGRGSVDGVERWAKYRRTFDALPSVIGREGAGRVLEPKMSRSLRSTPEGCAPSDLGSRTFQRIRRYRIIPSVSGRISPDADSVTASPLIGLTGFNVFGEVAPLYMAGLVYMAGLAFTACGIHWFAMAHRRYIDASAALDGDRDRVPLHQHSGVAVFRRAGAELLLGLNFLAQRAGQQCIYSAGSQPEVRDFMVGAVVVVLGPRSFS